VTQAIVVSDDRRVTYDWWGDPDGFPVFLMHGTPGSHSGPRPRSSVLYRLGVQLICYNRPGYGESTRQKGRRVVDAAEDVKAIAEKMGLGTFGVVGRSGGGPHALACAAQLGKQVSSTAVLVSLAPHNAEGLDWHKGMTESNIADYNLADGGQLAVEADLTERAELIRRDPENLLKFLEKELTDLDNRVVTDVSIRQQLHVTYKEAVQESAYGWIDDVLAFRRPWGFDLAEIKSPVLLWHGTEDVFSPPSHTHWLAEKISGATLDIQPSAAHFDAVRILPRILANVKARSERLRVEGTQEMPPAAQSRDAGVLSADDLSELDDNSVAIGTCGLVAALVPGK